MENMKKSITLSYTTVNDKRIFIANDLYIIKVLEGSLNFKMNKSLTTLCKEDIVIVHQGTCFTLEPDADHNMVSFIKLDKSLCRMFERGVGPRFYYANSAKSEALHPELFASLRNVTTAITVHEVLENRIQLFNHLKHLFDLLLNHFNYITCGANLQKFNTKMLDRYTYIYKKYFRITNQNTLLDIAEDLTLNYDYLRKDISKRYGMTYHQMKDIMRVNTASKLVMDSDLSLTEISSRTGFSDHKYMVDRFKTRFNMTPSELRNVGHLKTYEHMMYMKIV